MSGKDQKVRGTEVQVEGSDRGCLRLALRAAKAKQSKRPRVSSPLLANRGASQETNKVVDALWLIDPVPSMVICMPFYSLKAKFSQ